MAAFEKAVEVGADAIECDVHLSADDVPVIVHDATVTTQAGDSTDISKMTLAQIKQLDVGSAFSPSYAGEHIPTLDNLLQIFGPQILLNIELKSESVRDKGLEQAVVKLVKKYQMENRVLFSSFNPFSLRRAKKIAPHIPAGLLYAPDLALYLRRAWLAPLSPHEARHPEHTMVDASYMAWARRRGYQVNAWTVDDPQDMHRLIALGVHGIITNVPQVLHDIIEPSP
jgi:glycerophosphoryl diester phosphodiesterase